VIRFGTDGWRGVIADDFTFDNVRLVARAGALREAELEALRARLRDWLDWLRNARTGCEAQAREDHFGTCSELARAALCAYLGELGVLREQLEEAKMRIATQLRPDGSERGGTGPRPAPGRLLNLELWASLARLARSAGVDLWGFATADGRSLPRALEALARRRGWSEPERLRLRILRAGSPGAAPGERYGLPARAEAHSGVAPFWMLGIAGRDRRSGSL